ncbi:MAG: hypothetical protein KAW13_02120 [Dehalococcoidia bacterium]|nr:hypothetical protein [Dehalococcoidia bacterium]
MLASPQCQRWVTLRCTHPTEADRSADAGRHNHHFECQRWVTLRCTHPTVCGGIK